MAAPERIDLGSGLLLRRWRPADAEAQSLAIAESREHLLPWMPWAASASLQERRTTLARWEQEWDAGGDLVYGLFLGAHVVGGCGLHRRLGPDGLEIGYWVHAAHTRRGYATAASAALTSVAFTLPGITVVEIHHDRANLASEGVPRKLGFMLIGESPQRSPAAPAESGIWRVWMMTRDTWRSPVVPAEPGG
ncbi:MAG: GNAT family N-acetyltransferase [Candidatus Dormibacteria bacterium]|jgi:RimJ/RimL family protein N-acetyltransferase